MRRYMGRMLSIRKNFMAQAFLIWKMFQPDTPDDTGDLEREQVEVVDTEINAESAELAT
jgi:hypothetical protein